MTLSGKTIFITGATSGFGLACARQCAAQGARLVLCGRRKERLAEIKKELDTPSPLEGEGRGGGHKDQPHPLTPSLMGRGNIHTLQLDVRDRQAVEKAVASLPAPFKDIDVLVNNAGLALGLSPFDQSDLADAEAMIDTNIKGLLYCTHAILPGMIARDRGHIVNLSSVAGTYPYPGGHVYGATKAFVTQFSLNLRADLLGKNVRVTNIEPGMAETEFSLVRFHGDADKADTVYQGVTPLSADDIADAILWAITRPPHVNVNRVEIMPVQQAFSAFAIHRGK